MTGETSIRSPGVRKRAFKLIEPFDADSVGTQGKLPFDKLRTMPAVRKCEACGFTLIELLVVIAIIALLVAILMPSLQQAKVLAQRAVCGVNEHNIALAIHMYADDYNDWLPSAGSPLGCMMTEVYIWGQHPHGGPSRLGHLYITAELKNGGSWDRTEGSGDHDLPDWKTDADYIDDLDTFYCPGRTYTCPPYTQQATSPGSWWWGWAALFPGQTWKQRGYAGYSFALPGTFAEPFFWYADPLKPNGRRRDQWQAEWQYWEWSGIPQLAWLACTRGWSEVASESPHMGTGVNVAFRDCSVQWVPSEVADQETCSDRELFPGVSLNYGQ